MNKWRFLRCIKIIVCVALGIFLIGFITKSLWNHLIPSLFNGPVINIGQALGLLVLGRLFFGGLGWRRGGCGQGGPGWGRAHWRKRFEEKLSTMSPEQREKFKKSWSQKCGHWYGNTEKTGDTLEEK